MPFIRNFVKSCAIVLMGKQPGPRKIMRGLASGYRICVSPAENLAYLLGTAEPHLQRAIRRYVGRGDTVYDIGANLGYVSLSLAKRVGSNGKVIAFEPVPRNIEAFRQNIALNQIKNIRLIEAAASDCAGEATIRLDGNLSTASLVWHRQNPNAIEMRVATVAIDQLVESGELAVPTFVKIDVEGAEGAVLEGMRRTVATSRPVLFIECSEAGRERTWNVLSGMGYRCQSAITRKQTDDYRDYRHSDFLWLPKLTD